jgi:hypothetical protein
MVPNGGMKMLFKLMMIFFASYVENRSLNILMFSITPVVVFGLTLASCGHNALLPERGTDDKLSLPAMP